MNEKVNHSGWFIDLRLFEDRLECLYRWDRRNFKSSLILFWIRWLVFQVLILKSICCLKWSWSRVQWLPCIPQNWSKSELERKLKSISYRGRFSLLSWRWFLGDWRRDLLVLWYLWFEVRSLSSFFYYNRGNGLQIKITWILFDSFLSTLIYI